MSEEIEGVEGSFTNEILQEKEASTIDEKPINTMQDTIKEMGEIVHKKYPDSSSNLSIENTNGQIKIEVLNEYNEVNFGYTFKVLTTLSNAKSRRTLAVKGFGIEKVGDYIKSIHASFSQEQIPEGLLARLRGKF